jgi:hypothetical protein
MMIEPAVEPVDGLGAPRKHGAILGRKGWTVVLA